MRETGVNSVKEKIATGDFTSTVLKPEGTSQKKSSHRSMQDAD